MTKQSENENPMRQRPSNDAQTTKQYENDNDTNTMRPRLQNDAKQSTQKCDIAHETTQQ